MNIENKINKVLKILFLILTFTGLIISSYLTYTHFNDNSIVCIDKNNFSFVAPDSNENTCNTVLQSEYASILGIPTAILGIVFYISILIGFLLTILKKNLVFRKLLLIGTFIGVCFSAFFTYTQLFVLNSFCIYCFISACITLLLFGISLYFFRKK